MSRKLTVSLAAIALLASTALISGSANAKPNGIHGNHGNHGHHQVGHGHHFHKHVYLWRHHRYGYIRTVGYADRVVTPGPCTCLWKGYTPEGTVVFKDLCTQEMASAPIAGAPAQASEIQAPGNFAGKTYKDYLAVNPQAAPAEPQKN